MLLKTKTGMTIIGHGTADDPTSATPVLPFEKLFHLHCDFALLCQVF